MSETSPLTSKPAFEDAATLITRLRAVFAGLPDARKPGNNRRYEMEDAALSAFAVFFSQSPSFLDYQIRMQKQRGRNNATSLFGVQAIPCDNPIRKVLDAVPPETLFPLLAEIGDTLHRQGHLAPLRCVEKTFLIPLDGTTFFSSQKISCSCCSQTRLGNGKSQYRHTAARVR